MHDFGQQMIVQRGERRLYFAAHDGYFGSSTSAPKKGTGAAGIHALPSGCWWFEPPRLATALRFRAA
jgi:hypothetical protein